MTASEWRRERVINMSKMDVHDDGDDMNGCMIGSETCFVVVRCVATHQHAPQLHQLQYVYT